MIAVTLSEREAVCNGAMNGQSVSGWLVSSVVGRRLPWVLFGLTLLCFVPGVALAATQHLWDFGVSNLIWALSFLAFGAVGAIVAARRPENPIGWLLSSGALLVAVGMIGVEYATRAFLSEGRSWPASAISAWLGLVLLLIGVTLLLPVTALHFPDGHLPSRRWRWVRRLLAMAVAAYLGVAALAPGPLSLGTLTIAGETQNPFGLDLPPLRTLKSVVLPLLFVTSIVSFAAPYLRLRRAHGIERHQLKWFVYATALAAAGILTMVVQSAGSSARPAGTVINGLGAVGFVALPVSMGIAVLRYRLYEIDLVINRTLVYGILSLLLGAVYGVGVVLVPLAASLQEGNDLVVAASTLAVAALFSPLRHRVQDFVDRRFYRTRYNAGQTIAAFTTRLRQEVDVDEMGADLVSVVQQTFQPSSIGLLLKASPGTRESSAEGTLGVRISIPLSTVLSPGPPHTPASDPGV